MTTGSKHQQAQEKTLSDTSTSIHIEKNTYVVTDTYVEEVALVADSYQIYSVEIEQPQLGMRRFQGVSKSVVFSLQ